MIQTILKKLFFTTIISFILFPLSLFAQSEASITLDPPNPIPHSQVTLTVVSYAFDINQSTISWSSSGKELLKGVGRKKLTIQTGGVGEKIPIQVSVVSGTGVSATLTIDVIPESIDILFEAEENYVPLFYEGAALPGEESYVKFLAMPNMSDGGNVLSPSSISYFWYVDDTFMDEASGIGKQSAVLQLNTLRSTTDIKVVAHSPKGVVAEKTITMYPHETMPLLYTYDDILGANHSNLISRRLEITRDVTLFLEPFFLSTNNGVGGGASYEWLLDNLPITPLGGKLLTLRPKENDYGSKNLSVSISNSERTLQKGNTLVDIIFDTRK